MTKGGIASIVTGVVTSIILCASGVVFFASLIILLNGFMGQERAVNASLITYIVLAVLSLLISAGGGSWLSFYLAERRKWHAAGSAILSIVLACAIGTGAHIVSVIVAGIVADQMRTRR
jgi:uncharacterized protein YybS (DUF2232 family)